MVTVSTAISVLSVLSFLPVLVVASRSRETTESLVAPAWESPMASTTHCLEVNATEAHNFTDNSRWLWVSVPDAAGTAPPEKGWPVVINLAIIPFLGPGNATSGNSSRCYTAQHTSHMNPKTNRSYPNTAFTEEWKPFVSPEELTAHCSCFAANGTYVCPTIPDHGHHEEPRKDCSFDMLAGAIWFQRQKQYLLANGVAVIVLNTRIFDGWNIDRPSWSDGEDKTTFAALAREIADGKYGPIDPERVAFHGWSGGAQMVSNLAGIWGSGDLEGLTMKAGLMMSGGSQQCYNVPPLASAQCANCNASYECMTTGCSKESKGPPCCNMCCPQGETEAWYKTHPEDYRKHPAMFLGQVEHKDVMADGCAASMYHGAMQANNATSELHLVPEHEQRCFAIGQADDPSVEKASGGGDNLAKYCSANYMFNSMNHTTGSASMVLPLVEFIKRVL